MPPSPVREGAIDYSEGVAEYVLTLFPEDFKGVCIDVGAFDPFWISNSYLFEKLGWDVYCIEPNTNCITRLKQYRKNVLEYACGEENKDGVPLYIYTSLWCGPNLDNKDEWKGEAGATGLIHHDRCDYEPPSIKVNVRTLDWLIENEIKQNHVDYLSIDVELSEMSVLKGITLNKWKPKVIVVENLYEELDQHLHLENAGYKFIHRLIYNDFYIRMDNEF